ncbi:MAG: TonB family protein [Verrucomicrobia bacterium]|nr:TonB family protein [Verrucomicrobiota bacterium]
MSRLHKKCLVASAGTHLLLLTLLLVSPAFVPAKRELELPVLNLIPTKLTDEPFFGGGAPQAVEQPSPAQPSPPAVLPPPQAPQVQVNPPEPVRPEPKPARKPEPQIKPVKPNPRSKEPTAKPPRVKPDLTKRWDDSKTAAAEAKARAKAEAAARAAQAQRLQAFNRLTETVNRSGASSGGIDIPLGPGGGEAYANYSQVVKSIYQNAWLPPDDLTDDSAKVLAEVVILRDGKVKSAKIIRPSRIPSLDRSVERVLELRFIRPFPEGAKDTERTFRIEFDPKLRQITG